MGFKEACQAVKKKCLSTFQNEIRLDVTLPNQYSEKGLCLIHYAAKENAYSIMEWLLVSYSETVNQLDQYGYTPLMHAAGAGYDDIVRLLIKNGADVAYVYKNPVSPLLLAAKNGHARTVEYLLSQGADYLSGTANPDTAEILSPLAWAVEYGHHDVVKILVPFLPIGNLFHRAVTLGHITVLELLLSTNPSLLFQKNGDD